MKTYNVLHLVNNFEDIHEFETKFQKEYKKADIYDFTIENVFTVKTAIESIKSGKIHYFIADVDEDTKIFELALRHSIITTAFLSKEKDHHGEFLNQIGIHVLNRKEHTYNDIACYIMWKHLTFLGRIINVSNPPFFQYPTINFNGISNHTDTDEAIQFVDDTQLAEEATMKDIG